MGTFRAAALVALGCLGGAVLASQGSASEPKVLRVALNTDIRGTNPGVSRDANTDAVIHHVVEALVAYGEDLTIKPVVAERFRVEDEGRTHIFELRPDIYFHNGEPVTSAEVAWSWQRYLDPDTRWQCRRWFTGYGDDESDAAGAPSIISDIETPDRHTVVFRLEEPSTLFLDRVANVQCVSAILHPDSVDESGNWLRPVGTGPYVLNEWRPAEYVRLERFEKYRPRGGARDGLAGRKVAIADHVRFLVSPDAAATKAALLAGQIDVFHNIPMSALEDFENEERTVVLQSPTLGWSALLLQTRDPLLSDVRIRRAIAHAVDREMIVNFNTYGYASVNSSAVPVGAYEHTAVHDRWYPPDVKKARNLLREAGYRGEPIRIQTNRKFQNMYANAVVIQAMLHAAGMNAHIDVMDWASQLANYYAGDYQLSSFSFSAQATPLLRYYKLIGDKDRRAVYMWEDREARALLDAAISTFDAEERQRVFDELHRLMIEDVPILGLYNASYAAAMLDEVEGYEAWTLMLPRMWGVSKNAWD